MRALVKENFSKPGSGYQPVGVRVEGNGSGTVSGGEQVYRSCKLLVEPVYNLLM